VVVLTNTWSTLLFPFAGNAIKLLAEILQQWNRERGGLQLVSLEGAVFSR
jgi:hypothetical protein